MSLIANFLTLDKGTLYFLIISVIIIKLLIVLWNRRHLYRLSYQCEGPISWPVIGNLFDFGTGQILYRKLHQFCAKYHYPIRAWMGPFLFLIIHDPDDIKIILNHEEALSKPFVYHSGKDWVEGSLLNLDVPTWRIHRRIISPTFSGACMKNFMEIFNKQSIVFVKQAEKCSNSGKYIDLFQYVSRCTLDIILESAMGIDIGSQTSIAGSYADQYVKSTTRAFEIIYERTIKIWYLWDQLFRLTNLYKELLNCVKIVHKIANKIIAEKRPLYEKKALEKTSNEILGHKSRKTFIDHLLTELTNTNSEWTDANVRDEITTMIVAGADTTAHCLSYTFLLLAMHPEVQDKVYEEIKNVEALIGSPENLTIETLNGMRYMKQVIKESLRLFPVVPLLGRNTTGDIKLKSKNIVVPKDVFVVVASSMVHRSKKYWGPQADEFNPDNFSPENIRKRHPNAFLAFSDGPRNCLGTKFGYLSMQAVLFNILGNYKVETEEKFEDIRCELNLMLEKVGGWKVKISPRSTN